MAITLVGGNGANTTSCTVPAGHQNGDFMLLFAGRAGSSTAPVLQAGWNTVTTNTTTSTSYRLAWRVAQSGAESSGTWLNATGITLMVYRGVATNKNPWGAGFTNTAGSGSSITFNPPVPQVTNINSWTLGWAVGRTATNVGQAPASMTLQSTALQAVGGSDTNGISTGFTAASITVNTASNWLSLTLELLPETLNMNNYLAVDAPDGMSVTEKIR